MIRIVFKNAKEPEIKYGIFINDSSQPFTTQILNKEKTIETRNSETLHQFVGTRVGIVRTEKGKATLVGFADGKKEITYDTEKEFNNDYSRKQGNKTYAHLIKPDKKRFCFDDSTTGYKVGYYLTNVKKWEPWQIPDDAYRHGRIYVDISEYFKDR